MQCVLHVQRKMCVVMSECLSTCRVENLGGSSSPAAAFFSRSIVRLANAKAENNRGGNVCCSRVRPPSEKYSRAPTSM